MLLSDFEFIMGIFSLSFVVISTYIGIRIILKYFKYNRKDFLYFGFTWIFVAEVYYPSAISFLFTLITNNPLPEIVYFFIGNVALQAAIPVWLTVFTELKFNEKKKIIIILSVIFEIVYEIIFIYVLFTNTSLIGGMLNAVDAEYRNFHIIYLIVILSIFTSTGIFFALETLQSKNPEIKLQGKFLFIGFISLAIGVGLDGLKPFLFPNVMVLVLVINRIILITSAIEFYIGFTMPKRIKKIFSIESI